MPAAVPSQRRSRETRAAILCEAEAVFMEKGFDGARLEDVALAVGIKRAAIAYYFKDKRELYETVLAEVFGGWLERLEATLDPETGADPQRAVEAAVLAWIDYLIERPALTRIFLRELADAGSETRAALAGQVPPFVRLVEDFARAIATVRTDFVLPRTEAAHVAAALAGATLFFGVDAPTLLPYVDRPRDARIAEHKAQVLRMTRLLLEMHRPEETEHD
jgi:AcrR family transcriptional regulator